MVANLLLLLVANLRKVTHEITHPTGLFLRIVPKYLKGGPEPLEKESHEFLGSKRDDRFSNPFFEMEPKTCQDSFFVLALA